MTEPSATTFRTAPEHGAGVPGLRSAPGPVWTPPAITDAPAGFWVRLGAYILDSLVLLVAWLLMGGITYAGLNALFAGLGFLALALFYSPIMWAYNDGATWGKQALRQRVVVHADHSPIGLGRALSRELARGILGSLLVPALVSAVMIGARKDKRGLHDLMVGTAVVMKAREPDHI
jgi:uncharacterized RDD family membrane protein YckC